MTEKTRVRWAIVALCGVQFVDVLGVTSAITAIPAMLAGVSAPAAATPMLATSYAMFFGGLLVLGGRLGDRYGHRRVLLLGTAAFSAVGLVGASAQEVIQLIAARGLQGAAAAVSVPCALRLLLDAAPGQGDRRNALAVWSASGAAAGALGYLVGGVLTEAFGWRAVFWVNVPVGLLLLLALQRSAPRTTPDQRTAPLDLIGAVLLIGAVMTLIAGASLVEDPHRRAIGALVAAAGVGLGAGFWAHQRRSDDPLVPRAAFASANLRTGTAVSFVNTATTSSIGVLATLFLQQQLAVSAVAAGLTLVPFSLGVVAGAALSKPLGQRLPARRLAAAGLLAIATGGVLLVLTYDSIAGIVAGVGVAGTGLGVASVAGNAIGTDVPDTLSGTASGVLNTGAQLGTAIGVAALLALAANVPQPWPGTAVAWAAAAAIAGLTALVLLTRGSATRRLASASPATRAGAL